MSGAPKAKSLTQIAVEIAAHLWQFESDPKINKRDRSSHLHGYYRSRAVRAGKFVSVSYAPYRGNSLLDREQAERYLAWLDAGHVGTHHEALEGFERKDT